MKYIRQYQGFKDFNKETNEVLLVGVRQKGHYMIHKDKNEMKKKSIIENGYNYIMILDKKYEDFMNLYFNI